MTSAYLTIDDSPSTRMDDLCDYLLKAKIPALFFCRGDLLEERPMMAVRAIQNGFVLGNHGFSHTRASDMKTVDILDEIEKTEALIDKLYGMAGEERKIRTFRFPHMDRGCGSWIVDYNEFTPQDRQDVMKAMTEGLNVISMDAPDLGAVSKKEQIQGYLKMSGFGVPFENVNHKWYQYTEIQNAADCMFTYSTCDWMLANRHKGKWPYQTIEDLKSKIGNDPGLSQKNSTNIVLAHDQAEIHDITVDLIRTMKRIGIQFLEIPQ